MLTWLRSWKGGLVVAAACLVAGLVRVVAAPLDLLTVGLFPLAVAYGVAAEVERRMSNARRAATRADGADPMPWSTQPSRLAAWLRAERGYAREGAVVVPPATSTKDRVGAVLAIAAGVLGLVLVFQGHDGREGHTPAAPIGHASPASGPVDDG
ncbi:hypothetical protein [Actinomycetospora chibensis]|uniref:Uncharacterized protein n=1 Tax=Actinomycetospora chibensis TaxID=663606 RepID=A0ABV9RHD6_9PSEU|nr:hypothetical protein [Actinomycetospora chibensis]MDD7926788.1 hypothetical protein [Actinomycetospora chibensis]